jgi:hypothetical protein
MLPLFLFNSFAAAWAAPVSFSNTVAIFDVVVGSGRGGNGEGERDTTSGGEGEGEKEVEGGDDGDGAMTMERHDASSTTAEVPGSSVSSEPHVVVALSTHALSSSVSLNLPAVQSAHAALSNNAVPVMKPFPVEQVATECGLQIVCPVVSANVPAAQTEQGLVEAND